ncbi:hypothetical protein CC78DRAFT_537780 [Lojkania enalia]|uniref:Uncharacterized protein n=1 Tax=Lojkania enalia TaxID=147567 RepID=A0A9P4MV11_9PLEO|nr:hypothetical protein CC78DRAFT_537780 [Didymosphaeria enalia]
MANKPPPHFNDASLNIHPPPPASTSSNSNAPFTPRSSTFPDDLDSDSEFNVFEPTPTHSPGGPTYDDLPPSYAEAQQQALEDARTGRPPLSPNDLEIHRMILNDNQPMQDRVRPQPRTSLLDDRDAYEFEPENRRNGNGLGMTVPVQQSGEIESIPIGRETTVAAPPSDNMRNGPPFENAGVALDPTSILMNQALEFTRHEPDADARYASRLTRCVAIPQESIQPSQKVIQKGEDRQRRCRRRERGRGPPWAQGQDGNEPRLPGQWPTPASSESLSTEIETAEEPVQFLRAYAKALHAHSIRPAEFTEFLDGLNALCLATNTTTEDLIHPEPDPESPSRLVFDYINATNESFFAPRGLKVSLQSLSILLGAIQIPEQRGRRAGAMAGASDEKSTAEQRANALHPWIERLETKVPEPSTQTLVLREMVERLRRRPQSTPHLKEDPSILTDAKKSRQSAEDENPPHSIPEPPTIPEPPAGLNSALFAGPGRGWSWGPWNGNPGPWGGRGGGPCGRRGWGWPPHPPPGPFRPWGPQPHHSHSHHHHPHPGHHPDGGPGRFTPSFPGIPPLPHGHGNNWTAWGEIWGKWGEEFGKNMEVWGQQFGKRAEEWGTNFGKRAEAWGEDIASGASGQAKQNAAATTGPSTANAGPEGLRGQETGVQRNQSASSFPPPSSTSIKDDGKDRKNDPEDDDDDDTLSISSSSSITSPSPALPSPSHIFTARIREINLQAAAAQAKGKKSLQQIEQERDQQIEKAAQDRAAADLKLAQKMQKREIKTALQRQKEELKHEHQRVKRELKGLEGDGGEGEKPDGINDNKSKQEGKAKLSKQDKNDLKQEYRARKKELRDVKADARRERKGLRDEYRRKRREGSTGLGTGVGMDKEGLWVVVENLGG